MNINAATKPNDQTMYKYYMDMIKKNISDGIIRSKRDKKDYKITITLEKID